MYQLLQLHLIAATEALRYRRRGFLFRETFLTVRLCFTNVHTYILPILKQLWSLLFFWVLARIYHNYLFDNCAAFCLKRWALTLSS